MSLNLQTPLSSKSTGRLLLSLKLKKSARVMITTNIDWNDRLINGHFRTAYDFGFTNSSITNVYLQLDDENAGKKKAISKVSYTLNHQVVPSQMVEANIKISKD